MRPPIPHEHRRCAPRAAAAARPLLLLLLVTLAILAGGCVSGSNGDAQLRDELRAFADTSSSRVAKVCDDIARDSNDLSLRARLNAEKIRTANMGIENAGHPNATTGMLDMVFQFDVKARKANERAERAATRPAPTVAATGDPADNPSAGLDPYASQFAAVYARNRDDIWALASRHLTKDQQRGLHTLIDRWYEKNGQAERSSIRINELKAYAGKDPAQAATISLVDLRESNEQVDRITWMAQKLYQNSHWQVRQFIYDVVKEIERPRNESLDALTEALGRARDDTLLRVGPWVLGVVAAFLLVNVMTLILSARNRRADRELLAAVAKLLANTAPPPPPADWPIDRPTTPRSASDPRPSPSTAARPTEREAN